MEADASRLFQTNAISRNCLEIPLQWRTRESPMLATNMLNVTMWLCQCHWEKNRHTSWKLILAALNALDMDNEENGGQDNQICEVHAFLDVRARLHDDLGAANLCQSGRRKFRLSASSSSWQPSMSSVEGLSLLLISVENARGISPGSHASFETSIIAGSTAEPEQEARIS